MRQVFISYRRTDTAGYASWIYDRLATKFGSENVFMDVDSVTLGVDFADELRRVLGRANVAIVLIGPRWLEASDELGNRRIDDPADFVRMEVAAALRSSSSVIPVLVDGAQMPQKDSLPEDLGPLLRRQALVFDRSGGASLARLETTIEQQDDNDKRREPRLHVVMPHGHEFDDVRRTIAKVGERAGIETFRFYEGTDASEVEEVFKNETDIAREFERGVVIADVTGGSAFVTRLAQVAVELDTPLQLIAARAVRALPRDLAGEQIWFYELSAHGLELLEGVLDFEILCLLDL